MLEVLVPFGAPNDGVCLASVWVGPDENKEFPRPFISPNAVDDDELSFDLAFSLVPKGEDFAAAGVGAGLL